MLCLRENKTTWHWTRYDFKQNAVFTRGCFVALMTGQSLYQRISASRVNSEKDASTLENSNLIKKKEKNLIDHFLICPFFQYHFQEDMHFLLGNDRHILQLSFIL